MLILVGPSASGKTQVVNALIKNHQLKKLVTNTTRPMRIGEVDGLDYHFQTLENFKRLISENYFLEYVTYNGNLYGTSFNEIKDDKVVILEPNGLKTYLEKLRDQVLVVYFDCPVEILKSRMALRGDSEQNINERISLDHDVFTDDIKKLADYIVDTSKEGIEECADEVSNLYQQFLERKNNGLSN